MPHARFAARGPARVKADKIRDINSAVRDFDQAADPENAHA
jgi:hypothetical protein